MVCLCVCVCVRVYACMRPCVHVCNFNQSNLLTDGTEPPNSERWRSLDDDNPFAGWGIHLDDEDGM